ncbi:unnamed protein product [Brassica rapa subsp. narinosa]|uniref:(rape) hypothetical protein n=1 Tax=Brassica napus TaxID=3708 RepID=A0A817B3G1_BRANA|nr:unnamed protein product [Brassica napus]
MTKVFFSDLKTGRFSSVVEARLLRFWEAKNVKRGGELMWMDLLMVDVNDEKKPTTRSMCDMLFIAAIPRHLHHRQLIDREKIDVKVKTNLS